MKLSKRFVFNKCCISCASLVKVYVDIFGMPVYSCLYEYHTFDTQDRQQASATGVNAVDD